MKPRIFIHIHYLEIGGAETALIGLLQTLDPQRADVDLFLNDHRGEMMRFIPEWVNLLPPVPAYTLIERPMIEALRRGFFRLVAARLWAKFRCARYVRKNRPTDGSAIFGYVGKYVTRVLPSLKKLGTYDLALSFLTPHDLVLDKVSARKKICWIHTDYTQIDVDAALEYPVWKGYDYIASISDEVTCAFLTRFPLLENKIMPFENILSPDFIRKRSEEKSVSCELRKSEGETVLLTVGRYSYPKRLEEIPCICRYLTENGFRVKWYIIGYGGSDEYIRRAIVQEGMEENVILLDKRSNPYPYIKACDWYVQPSRYEGKSVVVREAQILRKPVIITAYPTAASQVKNGTDGVIVPLETKACAEAMCAVLGDEHLKQSITAYLSSHDYGNEAEVNKIYSLL